MVSLRVKNCGIETPIIVPILPSTFQYYEKGEFGKTTGYGNHATLEILGGRGDQNGALSYYASYW